MCFYQFFKMLPKSSVITHPMFHIYRLSPPSGLSSTTPPSPWLSSRQEPELGCLLACKSPFSLRAPRKDQGLCLQLGSGHPLKSPLHTPAQCHIWWH